MTIRVLQIEAVFCFLSACILTGCSGEQSEARPLVVAASDALRFGTLYEQADQVIKIPYENISGEAIEIVKWKYSCDCLSAYPSHLQIPQDETRLVSIHLANRKSSSSDSNFETSQVSAEIVPVFSDGSIGNASTVEGTVRRIIEIKREKVFLEDVVLDSEPSTNSIRLSVLCHEVVESLVAEHASVDLTISISKDHSQSGSYQVIVTPLHSVTHEVGEIKDSFSLVAINSAGEKISNRKISVVGRIIAKVRADPPAVMFGTLKLGEVATETITLIYGDETNGEVKVHRTPEVSLAVTQSEDSNRYRIDWTPTEAGMNKGSVAFHLGSLTGDDSFKIIIPVTCYVIP